MRANGVSGVFKVVNNLQVAGVRRRRRTNRSGFVHFWAAPAMPARPNSFTMEG